MDNSVSFNLSEKEDLGERLVQYLKYSLDADSYWSKYLDRIHSAELKSLTSSIHLAIFVEPFLQFLLDGKKTIESRFSINRCPPFNKVAKGDLLLIKKSGGPIVAICTVKERWYYRLDQNSWEEIRQYQEALCATDPSFWE
ncbi:MAG TPA: ASCH domain-containing protein, partial [Cyclobacteriaceae bacterium]|nr:ASCH domain-containing protein [Cyclobacteriaceae bacterium]